MMFLLLPGHPKVHERPIDVISHIEPAVPELLSFHLHDLILIALREVPVETLGPGIVRVIGAEDLRAVGEFDGGGKALGDGYARRHRPDFQFNAVTGLDDGCFLRCLLRIMRVRIGGDQRHCAFQIVVNLAPPAICPVHIPPQVLFVVHHFLFLPLGACHDGQYGQNKESFHKLTIPVFVILASVQR